jgi:TRAP-type C4-dicarboxylate transport system substrate-binding protein
MRLILGLVVSACALLLPFTAAGDPIKLRLAFFTSDRAFTYHTFVKPFVDAVNSEGRDLVEIEVYFGGALGKPVKIQPQLVLDGIADLALIVPGYSPEQFSDNDVMELPGLFATAREASIVFTRLLAQHVLRGYDDFFVVGAYATDPQNIHSRRPIGSLDDLRGLTIRVNNLREAQVVERFGAAPAIVPINQVAEAITRGTIDAATAPPGALLEFGIGRVAANHFMLRLGVAPLALVMNRNKLNSLPPAVQNIIRKYSGEWIAERASKASNFYDEEAMILLTADARRRVITPSQSDTEQADRIFKAVADEWSRSSPRNRQLLFMAESEIAKIRATDRQTGR